MIRVWVKNKVEHEGFNSKHFVVNGYEYLVSRHINEIYLLKKWLISKFKLVKFGKFKLGWVWLSKAECDRQLHFLCTYDLNAQEANHTISIHLLQWNLILIHINLHRTFVLTIYHQFKLKLFDLILLSVGIGQGR